MNAFSRRILDELRDGTVLAPERLGQIETNPQFAQIVPPTEMVVLVTLETKVGDVEGMMNFCIPYLTIEPIIPKLSAQYVYSSLRKGTTTENLTILRERLAGIEIALVLIVGKPYHDDEDDDEEYRDDIEKEFTVHEVLYEPLPDAHSDTPGAVSKAKSTTQE